MQTSIKVIFNTTVLYAKAILSLAIAFVSTPLVLNALGASDYDLYNLVVGVVAMLSFLNSPMTASTQRFMPVATGEKSEERVNSIYSTSFLLHLLLGLLVVVAFETIGLFAIDRLNTIPERVRCAKVIYQLLIFSTFAKIVSVLFDALINTREDMLPFSVIELIDSALMLAVALPIAYISGDKLIYYGACVAFISVLTSFMKYGWCRYAYKDCCIQLNTYRGKFIVKEMVGFTGWNLSAGLAMIGRNQGVAVIINISLGTTANVAYGVANQINGALGHFPATFQEAINPQLMKSEGMNDRNKLLRVPFISSKFFVLALAFFAVPFIMEMNEVLAFWLKDDILSFTLKLAQYILLLPITYQYSVGIMATIQAMGEIRNYQVIMGNLLLMNVPIAYLILKMGYSVYYTTIASVILELISLCVRLFMANKLTDMSVKEYIQNVIQPAMIIIVIPVIVAMIPHPVMSNSFLKLVIVCSIYCLLFAVLMLRFAFNEGQREHIKPKIQHLLKR